MVIPFNITNCGDDSTGAGSGVGSGVGALVSRGSGGGRVCRVAGSALAASLTLPSASTRSPNNKAADMVIEQHAITNVTTVQFTCIYRSSRRKKSSSTTWFFLSVFVHAIDNNTRRCVSDE
jgi:hypothetical protein